MYGGGGGGVTDNMLDDNVLGSVDNQENIEAPHEQEHDARRRRRRDTVLHQPQKQNINQVSLFDTKKYYFFIGIHTQEKSSEIYYLY